MTSTPGPRFDRPRSRVTPTVALALVDVGFEAG